MSRQFDVTVVVPSSIWFSQNSRGNWAAKYRSQQAVKQRARLAGLDCLNRLGLPHPTADRPLLDRCRVVAYVAYPPNANRADPGNAADMVKPMVDALTDLHYWVDDDSRHVIGPDYRRASNKAKAKTHEIRLQIEELEDVGECHE